METLGWIQILAWLGTAGAACVALWRANVEIRLSRELRERELLWKQSSAAAESLDAMEEDHFASDAMLMLDWDGREFTSQSGAKHLVTHHVMYNALRTTGGYDDAEIFIRDCFDHLYYHLNRLQHHVEIKIINPRDIDSPTGYLAMCMARNREVFEKFMIAYHYNKANTLISRLIDRLPPAERNTEIT